METFSVTFFWVTILTADIISSGTQCCYRLSSTCSPPSLTYRVFYKDAICNPGFWGQSLHQQELSCQFIFFTFNILIVSIFISIITSCLTHSLFIFLWLFSVNILPGSGCAELSDLLIFTYFHYYMVYTAPSRSLYRNWAMMGQFDCSCDWTVKQFKMCVCEDSSRAAKGQDLPWMWAPFGCMDKLAPPPSLGASRPWVYPPSASDSQVETLTF